MKTTNSHKSNIDIWVENLIKERIQKYEERQKFLNSSKLLRMYAESLDEALITSYPAKKVKEKLENFFDNEVQNKEIFKYLISEIPAKGTQIPFLKVEVVAPSSFNLFEVENLEDFLSYFGWLISGSRKERIGKDIFKHVFVFEANKLTVKDSEISENTKKALENSDDGVFYHVSFSKFEKSILKYGLLASDLKRVGFNHPERTYLFTNLRHAKIFLQRHIPLTMFGKISDVEHMLKINTFVDRNTKKIVKDKIQPEKIGMVLFAVNLQEMVDDGRHLELEEDAHTVEDGVAYYTKDSISPYYIKKIDEFSVPRKLIVRELNKVKGK